MELGFTTAAYVVAAVLFILSLGGLSGQESAKRAVWYGSATTRASWHDELNAFGGLPIGLSDSVEA